ncbi:hypothetical protein CLAIMM_14318 [Cladophialophora immunda]|nr:hypothetical protein CLAIMM_14318 [Cladophialophora immunda]
MSRGSFGAEEYGRDFMWLAQARVHSKVGALYLGQPKAFPYAQHLRELLVGHATRMDLFSAAYAETCMRRFQNVDKAITDHERLAIWFHLEGRRRLAFAIFRAETYTSVLLQKKPLVSMEDIADLPSCSAPQSSSMANTGAPQILPRVSHTRDRVEWIDANIKSSATVIPAAPRRTVPTPPMANYSAIPDFDSLLKDGKKDRLGCLNFLTQNVVHDALQEARDGVSVSLNWGIKTFKKPGFGRKGLKHTIINFKEGAANMWEFNDEVEFNP